MTELVLSADMSLQCTVWATLCSKGDRQQIVVVQNIYKLKVHQWDA